MVLLRWGRGENETAMLRTLAILSFAAVLVFFVHGYRTLPGSPHSGSEAVAAALVSVSVDDYDCLEHDEDHCLDAHGCCHSSYSPSVALIPTVGSLVVRDSQTIGQRAGGRDLRSILLKRDPPIPRRLP